jgi:hypothetical protein
MAPNIGHILIKYEKNGKMHVEQMQEPHLLGIKQTRLKRPGEGGIGVRGGGALGGGHWGIGGYIDCIYRER